jgi:hypothetical protein
MSIRMILTTVIVGVTLVNASRAAGDIERPTPHELVTIAAIEGPRLWYHEEEFLRNPALRATPEHVVILHLTRAPKHQRFIDHAIPYLFAETATYTFCLPKKEPFLQDLEVIREGSIKPGVQLKQGNKCQTREIVAGFYQLQVRHDGRNIGLDGKKAFIHVPRFKGVAGVGSRLKGQQVGATLSSFPSSCDPNTFNTPQFTFTAPMAYLSQHRTVRLYVSRQRQAIHFSALGQSVPMEAVIIHSDSPGSFITHQHSSPLRAHQARIPAYTKRREHR